MTETPQKKARPSRLPYVLAVLASVAVVTTAWVTRGLFVPLVPGIEAPGFEVVDLQGNPVSLDDYRGKVVLVNIWATSCPPCVEEMPSMERLYRALSTDDFEILAVSVDADPGEIGYDGRIGGDVQEFAERFGLTFPVLRDVSGRIAVSYQATGLPESFLLDREGMLYKRIAGATAWDARQHVDLIQRLLETPASEP